MGASLFLAWIYIWSGSRCYEVMEQSRLEGAECSNENPSWSKRKKACYEWRRLEAVIEDRCVVKDVPQWPSPNPRG